MQAKLIELADRLTQITIEADHWGIEFNDVIDFAALRYEAESCEYLIDQWFDRYDA